MGLVWAVVGLVAAAGPSKLEVPGSIEAMNEQRERVDVVLAARSNLTEAERAAVSWAIVEESARAGYDPFLILGLMDVESDFRRDVVSSADARGLMQIQPITLGYLIEKNHWPISQADVAADPALCVRLGVRYVRQLHDRFGTLTAALMAYNMGPTKYKRLSKTPAALEAYQSYPNAVRRDARALKARHTLPATALQQAGLDAKQRPDS
ncbi:MAG: lytic transglycosylase domain-containing protein [Myxococcaceae bacterium]|nr:lytic transglycosylase domain-containing protein [Myxococcaceae bacterium]